MNDVTIVIPTLNEEQAIGKVIEELLSEGYQPQQILVVDGHSADNTVKIAQSYGVNVITQQGKGKAEAIATALDHVKTPYTLIMDGDYTYPASETHKLIAIAHRYDEVIGARLKGRENIPRLHRLGNHIITKAFNLLFGTNLRDICSGMYIVKTDKARGHEIASKGFNVEVELAAKIASDLGKITDTPITYRKRLGNPKMPTRTGFKILLETLKLAWHYNPIFLLFTLGSLLLIPGIALGIWVALKLLLYGVKHYIWGIAAIVLSAAGLQSLATATLALYLKRIEYRQAKKLEELIEATSHT